MYDLPLLRSPTGLFDISHHVKAHKYSQLEVLSLLQMADVKVCADNSTITSWFGTSIFTTTAQAPHS
jgi:hypothetical protein